jgi:hypothetical protein
VPVVVSAPYNQNGISFEFNGSPLLGENVNAEIVNCFVFLFITLSILAVRQLFQVE